jgi:hypothetical protein
MMRVTKSGGQVMITTPARLRYLWRPDPHDQVKGLMLLPDSRLTRTHDVQHVFLECLRGRDQFPRSRRSWPSPGRDARATCTGLLWKLFRSLLWDRIVIWKR